MTTWRLLGILLLTGAMTVATMGRTYADPPLQEEERVGLFGTVTAVVEATIILDSGETVATDENTRFHVPGVEGAGLLDIGVGDRLAIVAVELEAGTLLALHVLSTPEEPVSSSHVLGIVTATEDGLITLTDNQGNSVTIEVSGEETVTVGDYVTVVSSGDQDSDVLAASDIATIEEIVDRLVQRIEKATDKAVARLQRLLEDNGDEKLTALANALEHASEKAKDALEAALSTSHSHLEGVYKRAGAKGPYARVKGFVTSATSTATSTSVTIDDMDDGEVTLEITEATEIEDHIAVGDFVKAKYDLALLEAVEIELESDELTFRGKIQSVGPTELRLEDGTSFDLTHDPEIEGHLVEGAQAKVDALPVDGSFVAVEIKVEGDRGRGRAGERELEDFEIKGTITGLFPDDASPTSMEVSGFPAQIMITDGTEAEGGLSVGISVKVNPNPPKDTDGRREDSGRGWVRELQGRWPGVGVDGRPADGLQSPHRAPRALCGSCDARDGERIRSRGLSRPGWREIAGTLSQLQAGRQAGNGMACSRAKARLNWVSQGQRRGRCKVRRRAERVIRPTRAKTRRLRVLVITVRSPRPIRAVQRARLCAITWTASQAPLAAKRADGMWFSPTPYLRSRMAFSTSAWRR